MKHKNGFQLACSAPSPSVPTLVPKHIQHGVMPNWRIEDCEGHFKSEDFRCYSSSDTELQRYMRLDEFVMDHQTVRTSSYDMAAVDLSNSLAARLGINLPPLEIDDLYQGLYEMLKLNLTWLIVGYSGALNPRHTDIWNSSTWNILLSGAKEWTLDLPGKNTSTNFLQEPGDLINIPSGWAHEVLYLEDSVCITGNYVEKSNSEISAIRQENDGLSGLSNFTRKIARVLEK